MKIFACKLELLKNQIIDIINQDISAEREISIAIVSDKITIHANLEPRLWIAAPVLFTAVPVFKFTYKKYVMRGGEQESVGDEVNRRGGIYFFLGITMRPVHSIPAIPRTDRIP